MSRFSISSLFRAGAVLGVVAAVAACDTVDPSAYAPEYIVESYLVAGDTLPPIRLSRTAPVGEPYVFSEQAVSGAAVYVDRLGPDGTVAERFAYEEARDVPGVYRADVAHRVQPLATYALEVVPADGGARVTSSTVVPDTFRLVRASADTLTYQAEEQLELDITRSRYPGRDQAYFIFVTEALDPRAERLTRLGRSILERQEDVTLEELSRVPSNILNEANYEANDDGTYTIRYPWLGIIFYGPNRLTASALDDNLYDFLRTQSVQQQGSTRSPGEIPNVLDPVEGGRGIFGSYARVTYTVVVTRDPDVDP